MTTAPTILLSDRRYSNSRSSVVETASSQQIHTSMPEMYGHQNYDDLYPIYGVHLVKIVKVENSIIIIIEDTNKLYYTKLNYHSKFN